mgnify:CR=1 FL=1
MTLRPSEDTPFQHVAIIGLGLIGSSIARAMKDRQCGITLSGFDADPSVRQRVRELDLLDHVHDTPPQAVSAADLVILCVPVGAIDAAATAISASLRKEAVVSDVGSTKASVAAALRAALPGYAIVPAHPVAGTEQSGPDAGFATLFDNRWCILTPDETVSEDVVSRVSAFWSRLGASVSIMDAEHHDLVLAMTSHIPHLIAFTIVGTASDLEQVTRSEVIKYSAGGFRDFTRIAASNPQMWRDIFLNNKDAVLDGLQRFTEDLVLLQRAIRWDQGDVLESLFTRTAEIRRGIVTQSQDSAEPDFGRRVK